MTVTIWQAQIWEFSSTYWLGTFTWIVIAYYCVYVSIHARIDMLVSCGGLAGAPNAEPQGNPPSTELHTVQPGSVLPSACPSMPIPPVIVPQQAHSLTMT